MIISYSHSVSLSSIEFWVKTFYCFIFQITKYNIGSFQKIWKNRNNTTSITNDSTGNWGLLLMFCWIFFKCFPLHYFCMCACICLWSYAFKQNCHVSTDDIISILFIHIAVFHIIVHITSSWKIMNFRSHHLCFSEPIFFIFSVPCTYIQ